MDAVYLVCFITQWLAKSCNQLG